MEDPSHRFATRALHAGWHHDPATGSFGVPIYPTAAFQFDSSDHAASLFSLETPGHIYSRLSNPSVAIFEERMSSLEGGVASVATASGQAAATLLVATLCNAGDNVVAGRSLYGGTLTLLKNLFARFGVTPRMVNTDHPAEVKEAMDENTRAIFVETLGNPGLNVAPLEELGAMADGARVPLVVDNTFASPALCRPLEWGASVVFHSATKYLSGQGSVLGGVVVDGGNFDWTGGRWPQFTAPDPAYHGVVFAEAFGRGALGARLRCHTLRDMGGCLSPFNAYLLTLGLTTLELRMGRHSENALILAEFLEAHPAVAWVRYPGLPSHPHFDLARRYLPSGGGGMMAFSLRGGREAGKRFVEHLKLFGHVANVGDVRSLVVHPASTTHAQLSEAERSAAGVEEGLIRLSIGLEDPEDLRADLAQALRAAGRDA